MLSEFRASDVVGGLRRLLRPAVLLGALLACLAAPSALLAEDLPQVISPLQVEPDRNGVNLATGKITPPSLTLSIPAAPRLKFDTVQNAAPYIKGVEHRNWDTGEEQTGEWSLHTADGVSESFRCNRYYEGQRCESVTRSGSSLTYGGNYYQKAGSGERYEYTLVQTFTFPAGGDLDQRLIRQFYATKIVHPDGEVISFTYDSASNGGTPYFRPSRISTNLGYYISVAYAVNDITQVGWGKPSEAALYKESDPTTPLAKLTYNSDGSTTDLAGRLYYGFSPGSLGSDVETSSLSQTLPTESTPALTVTPTSLSGGFQMVSSVTRDMVQWNYAYTNPQYSLAMKNYRFDNVTVTGPNGYNTSYKVDPAGNIQFTGVRNLITRKTDELGRATNFEYDDYLRLTKAIAPEGNSVSIAYDVAGNIVSKTSVAKAGSGLASLVEQAFVDLTAYPVIEGKVDCDLKCWRMDWHRDALNRQTDFVYNARGQLTEQTDPADNAGIRRKTINEYQEVDTGKTHMESTTLVHEYISRKVVTRTCGVGTTCGTSDDTRVEYEYSGVTYLPSLERRIDPATGETRVTTFAYDNAGRILSVDGPLAGTDDTQYFRYDTLGRKTWEIGALAPNGLRLAKRFTYRDADDKAAAVEMGTLTSPTDTNLIVTERADTTYDTRRNPIRESRSSAGTTYAVTDRSFLDRGLADCAAVRMNLAALPAATAAGACTAGTIGSQGRDRITKNVYDAAAQLVQMREGVGGANEAAEATYSYTNNGKRIYVIDADGNRAQLTYDGHDRQVKWTFPSTTRPASYNDSTQATALSTAGAINAADYEQYGYDAAGNRTSLRKRDGSTLTYSYDSLNRMILKVVPSRAGLTPDQVRDVYYDYDLKGLMVKARFDTLSGDGVTSVYNGFGELTSSTINMSGLSKTLSYTYDRAGRRLELTHADGQKFTYFRDALGRATNIYEGTAQVSTAQLIQSSFDNRGLIDTMQRSTTGNAFLADFTFDPIARLSSTFNDAAGGTVNDLTISQTYNVASQIANQTRGNDSYSWTGSALVNRTYTTNGLNQYTAAGPASFTYDANGNLTSDGPNTFVYDIENRLVTETGAATATIVYDPMGRLFETSGGTAGTTRFLYDGDELVAEYDGFGTLARRYVHNDSVDDPVVQYDSAAVGAAARTFLMPDERGSIAGLFYNDGTLRAKNTYDEYGIPNLQLDGQNKQYNANQGRFQYTGQIWLDEIGMYYYKARIYSPKLGRFLQVDPIGYNDQINLYAYVGDDPVNKADPSGLSDCDTGSRLAGGSAACKLLNGFKTTAAAGKRIGANLARSAVGAANTTKASVVTPFKKLWNGDQQRSGYGDLTRGEVRKIQSVVDQAGRPLEVVGSAARGDRRWVGTDLPIGKGLGTKSDIDYTTALSSRAYFGSGRGLPDMANHGILTGAPEGPSIRFEPHAAPQMRDNGDE